MAESHDVRIERLLARFVALQEAGVEVDQDPEFRGLNDEDRGAIAALAEGKSAHLKEQGEADLQMAESFEWVASADLLSVLDRGWDLLDEASAATEPAGLLAALDQVAMRDRRDAVCALFAAVLHVANSGLDETPQALRELHDRWYQHVRAEALRMKAEEGGGS